MLASTGIRKFRWASLVIILLVVVIFELGFKNFGLSFRMLDDYYDRSNFLHIGNWILEGQIPYVDTVIEFPQITVYFFGLLNWLAYHLFPTGWPFEVGFMILWYPFMGIFLWISMGEVWKFLPEERKKLAWLMLLPASIYFSMNRFDILPVTISLLAVTAFSKRRYPLACILLGVGIFTKWYLAFFVIPFLIHEWRANHTLPWKSFMALCITTGIIVFPTWLSGGWDAVLQPYTWHLQRLVEPGTLLWLIYRVMGSSDPGWIQPGLLASVFTILSFSGLILGFWIRTGSVRKVILVAIVGIIPFLLFNRVFSPQWWLWLLPLLLLVCQDPSDLTLIVAYDLIVYLSFPILYDLVGNESMPYLVTTGSLLVLLIVFLSRSAQKIKTEN